MTWQPIETAPKDGTRILAYWQDVSGNLSATQVETWWGPLLGSKKTWQSVWEWADGSNAPTHWMHLPEPPQ